MMSGPMSVSMTIKIIDEATAAVGSITGAVRELKGAEQDLNSGTTATGTAKWEAERTAVDGVIGKVDALKAATGQASAPIDAAIGKLRDEAAAVDAVTTKMREMGGVRPPVPPSQGPTVTDVRRGGAGGGGEEAAPQDWGAYWQAKREGSTETRQRASDFVAQRQALQEVEDGAARATDRLEDLEHGMARYGMAAMAFGQVRGLGEGIRKPIEDADELFADMQKKTQDLATRSENNGGQKQILDHIRAVAKEANVPWEQVYEGEQSLVSFGGGKQLQAMAGYEARMNKLALAGHIEATDIYSSMMHYIKGGLSAAEAMDALEQQHVQGKRGSVELNQLTRYMPSLMALGKEFGMSPQQATTDVSALMQIMRENVGTAGEAATLTRHAMTKLGDPRTMKRLDEDLGIDGFEVRAEAKARGENPLTAVLSAIADKFEKLSPDQKGVVTSDGQGGGTIQGGDPKIMGDLARDYYFRAALDAFIQHRRELGEFKVSPEEARRTTDEDYAAQNSTVAQARQTATNARAEAASRAGETQTGVMKTVAGAQTGAWDAGGWMAKNFPGVTGIMGAMSDFGGGALKVLGQAGEAAIAAATAVKAMQWIKAKYPAAGAAADAVGGVVGGATDAVKGFAQGVSEGARQAQAEATAARATGTAAPEAASTAGGLKTAAEAASGAATKFAEASTELGTIGMLIAWASKSDMGFRHPPTDEQLAAARANPSPLFRLPGDPDSPARATQPAPALVPASAEPAAPSLVPAMNELTDALREQARRSADEFRREPEAARGRAMMENSGGIQAAITAAVAAAEAASPKPVATAAQPPQNVTNNQQKYVTASISVNAPITISATLNNTTPGAIANTVAGGIREGVRAGSAALHDGTETK